LLASRVLRNGFPPLVGRARWKATRRGTMRDDGGMRVGGSQADEGTSLLVNSAGSSGSVNGAKWDRRLARWARKDLSARVLLAVVLGMLGLASSSMLVTVESADDGGIRHSWIQNLAMHGDPHVAVHVAGDVANSIAKLSEPRLVDVLSSEFSEAMEGRHVKALREKWARGETDGDDRRVDMKWIEVPRSEARASREAARARAEDVFASRFGAQHAWAAADRASARVSASGAS